jgi:hypothetical protein
MNLKTIATINMIGVVLSILGGFFCFFMGALSGNKELFLLGLIVLIILPVGIVLKKKWVGILTILVAIFIIYLSAQKNFGYVPLNLSAIVISLFYAIYFMIPGVRNIMSETSNLSSTQVKLPLFLKIVLVVLAVCFILYLVFGRALTE